MTFRRFMLFLGLAATPLSAAERVALVIGNDAYQHASQLHAAVNDASAVAAALRRLNFDTISVTNAGLEDMVAAMGELKQRAAGAQAVMVYYAGHGIESGGANYLIPVDARLEREIQLETQALNLNTVLEKLTALKVPARMVVLDCCRDNPLEGRAWLATRGGGGGLGALREDELGEATLVVYSASPGKPALDRVSDADRHSPFTQAMLDELPVPDAHSFEVFGRIEEEVIRRTDARQKPRIFYNGSTLPFRSFRFAIGPASSGTSSVPASMPAPAPAPVVQQLPPVAPAPAPMVQELPPPAPAPMVPPGLPAQGYFDLDGLFATSAYAEHGVYSKQQILRQAQQKLGAQGLYAGAADGGPGPKTQAAIQGWQSGSGRAVTGRLDDATLVSLGLSGLPEYKRPAPARPSAASGGVSRPRPAATPAARSAQDILFGN